jgi:PKD domain
MRRAGGKLLVAFAILGAGPAALASPAHASPGWTPAADYVLPAGADPQQTQVGFQSGATATVAYLQEASSSPLQNTLQVGTVAPGAGFDSQLQLPSTASSVPYSVSLAVAPNGAAVVAWEQLQGTNPSSSPLAFLASYRAPGASSWSSATTIAADTQRPAGITPQLVTAIAPDGSAVAAADHLDPSLSPAGYRIDLVTFSTSGSASNPMQLAAGTGESAPNVALAYDAGDDLTAAYDLAIPGGGYTLAEQTESAGNWGALDDITGSDPSESTGAPRLAVAGDGSAVIAFQLSNAGGSDDVNAVTRSGAGGSWSSPVDIAPGGTSSTPLAAGISPGDAAYVLYRLAQAGSAGCAGVVSDQLGGAWSSPGCVSADNISPAAGAIAFNGQDAYLAWSGGSGGAGNVIEGSRWPAGASAPDPATNLDTAAPGLTLSQLVYDGSGSAVAFWTGAPDGALRDSAYDGTAPTLIWSDVPSHGLAGIGVTMTATFVDLWSPLVSIQWDFGDGVKLPDPVVALGPEVSHAYATVGAYTVTVTATDSDGNSTSASFPLTITATTPAISKVSQSAGTWREGSPPRRHRRSGHPFGTTFHFTLNEHARMTFNFTQASPGQLVGGACVPPTSEYAIKPSCTIFHTVASLGASARKGSNRYRFRGRIGPHQRLAPGRYTLVMYAVAFGLRSVNEYQVFNIASH